MSRYNKEMLNPIGSDEFLNSKPLVATDIHKEYGERVILVRVSVSVNPRDRIGVKYPVFETACLNGFVFDNVVV